MRALAALEVRHASAVWYSVWFCGKWFQKFSEWWVCKASFNPIPLGDHWTPWYSWSKNCVGGIGWILRFLQIFEAHCRIHFLRWSQWQSLWHTNQSLLIALYMSGWRLRGSTDDCWTSPPPGAYTGHAWTLNSAVLGNARAWQDWTCYWHGPFTCTARLWSQRNSPKPCCLRSR